MPMITKLVRWVTYHKEPPLKKLHYSSLSWFYKAT